MIAGRKTTLHIAVITLPFSNFRWARLYPNQKMGSFLDSHIRFFKFIGCGFKEGVYDNMKNVVSKFLGHNEKELNQQLIEMVRYYGFKVNVTNAFSGNEKGSVERSVDVVRNKAFAKIYTFQSIEEAQKHLETELLKINKDSKIEEERKSLNTDKIPFETAAYQLRSVNKYSFIQLDTNRYSVPDRLAGEKVLVKLYPDKLIILHDGNVVAVHPRCSEEKKTCLDIRHYLDTLKKKPGALRNSIALKSFPELHVLFKNYFSTAPRQFIELLIKHRELPLEELPDAIRSELNETDSETADPLKALCSRQLEEVSQLFISQRCL